MESEVDMKAEEYKKAGLYRLNAMIPDYLGQKLEELSQPSGLNMKKKDIVSQALMNYIEDTEKRLSSFKEK